MTRNTLPLFALLACFTASENARADQCAAVADFTHAFPSNELPSRFKFKFRLESSDCKEYACTGFVHYRIHYDYASGGSNAKTTLVRYRIPVQQKSVEVLDEVFPAGGTTRVKVRDVQVTQVTCSTP